MPLGQKTCGVRKGSYNGGISVYYRKKIFEDQISLVETHDNDIIWLKINQKLFHFNENVFICHLYIPPACSRVLQGRDFNFLKRLKQG